MRSLITIILIPGSLLIGACEPQKINSTLDPKDHQQIRSLTDRVLIALATHNYTKLKQLLGHNDQRLSGQQAALLLWGSRTSVAIIEHWNAQNTQVTIHAGQLTATATGYVFTKRSPNRKIIKTQFTFHFSRRDCNDPWALQTNSP